MKEEYIALLELRRWLASCADLFILGFFLFGLLIFIPIINYHKLFDYLVQAPLAEYTGDIIGFVIYFLFKTLTWTGYTASPGMLLFGLRIIDATTLEKITFKQAAIRILASIISYHLCGLGFIWAIFDKRGQTWHDKRANTVVVTKKSLCNYYKSISTDY